MNTIKIEAEKSDSSKITGGEIFFYSTEPYIVMRTNGLIEPNYVLISLKDGNIWSRNSMFGSSESDFKRFYGTLTITTE